MAFVAFFERFPEMGDQKVQCIKVVPGPDTDLPPGVYFFLEMFCEGVGCDCRRVLLSVVSQKTGKEVALIYWGWEPLEFYSRPMNEEGHSLPSDLKGPALCSDIRQSSLAPEMLKVVSDKLNKDEAFVASIKDHYRIFREKVAADTNESSESRQYKESLVMRTAPKVGRNDPCPCGSGKKHKKCCLGK